MKKVLITLLVIAAIFGNIRSVCADDSIATIYPLTSWGKTKLKLDKIAVSKAYKMTFVGVPLIIGGLIIKQENDHFRDLRNRFAPKFHSSYDDYLQYTPAALMLALKASGVESRSSWPRMLVSDAFSALLMAASVNLIKSTNKTLRPDGSTYNSFPSGHTATAFMAATMLHKEFGLTRSPWYSIAGYTIATATALGRQLNNRHWLSDVMVGAGIGILSTELGYFFADLIFKDKGIKRDYIAFKEIEADNPPSFFGYYLGFSIFPKQVIVLNDIKLVASTGSSAGFEGAWFFNPYIGIGGRLRVINMPVTLDTEHYFSNYFLSSSTESIQPTSLGLFSSGSGLYASYPFTRRWLLGTKILFEAQNSSGSEIKVNHRKTSGEDLTTSEVVKIEKFHSLGIGTGVTATFIANKNLSVRFFTDYDFVISRMKFKVNDKTGQELFANKYSGHMLTFGASVNIQF